MGIEPCDSGPVLHSVQPDEPISHPDFCYSELLSYSKLSHPNVVLCQGNKSNMPYGVFQKIILSMWNSDKFPVSSLF